MSWESVIPNVLAGDAKAVACPPMESEEFAGFYERSARALWAYLARVSTDPALADDLMQESYVRFLGASRPEEGEVAARRYLFASPPTCCATIGAAPGRPPSRRFRKSSFKQGTNRASRTRGRCWDRP